MRFNGFGDGSVSEQKELGDRSGCGKRRDIDEGLGVGSKAYRESKCAYAKRIEELEDRGQNGNVVQLNNIYRKT